MIFKHIITINSLKHIRHRSLDIKSSNVMMQRSHVQLINIEPLSCVTSQGKANVTSSECL